MGLVFLKITLILANDIPSMKTEGGWALLVLPMIRLILANNIPSTKINGGWVGASIICNDKTDFDK